jgi:hypothetical protein
MYMLNQQVVHAYKHPQQNIYPRAPLPLCKEAYEKLHLDAEEKPLEKLTDPEEIRIT